MNVMLIGGVSNIGNCTAVVRSNFGHQIVLCDSLSNSSDSFIEKISQVTFKKFRLVSGDMCDPALHQSTLATRNIDAVIHLAA